jgi:Adenylate kinase
MIFYFFIAVILLSPPVVAFAPRPISFSVRSDTPASLEQPTRSAKGANQILLQPAFQRNPIKLRLTGVIATLNSSTNNNAGSCPTRIIIAGAPASGKGTQCEKITAKYGVVHLSTGDMLRAAVAAGTEVGREAKAYMDAGKLVPDSTIIGVVRALLRFFLNFLL